MAIGNMTFFGLSDTPTAIIILTFPFSIHIFCFRENVSPLFYCFNMVHYIDNVCYYHIEI